MSDRGSRRWGVVVARSLTVVLLVLAAIRLADVLTSPFGQRFLANDLNGYLAGTQRFLETGSPFLPEQLSGAWQLAADSFIHPPPAVLLFAPFLILPAILWWIIPIGLTMAAVVRLRPAAWAWPVMAACLLWPRSAGILIAGNSDLWVTAALAVTLAWSLPVSVLIALKPSYLPFALAGAVWRRWWIGAAAVVLISALFGALWLDYLAVLRGISLEPLYSLLNAPYVLIPVIAWLARTRPAPQPRRLLPWRPTPPAP